MQKNARQSLASLGKRIGLSQPAMSERVQKLEAAGVIENYSAQVSLREVGAVRLRRTANGNHSGDRIRIKNAQTRSS
ncbi:Lrp/AsnC family transcriptional regulator [Pseudomonas sp. xss_2]|uniref:Lrp/AsnC family transcriptional regulator n=1 Tax=Pseudomonas sp. xss_2 TaxID=3367215 RepID=UPI00370C8019